MKLKEIGEFGFIERFKPLFGNLVKDLQMGIGDDCAIIPANDKEVWLITTDLLMEDVHFLRNVITAEQLGYKSLAVNLSDIAAMGGTPVASFLSIAIPTDVDVEYLDAFMKGYHELSANFDIPLLGGDTTKSLKHMAINVCVIGKCAKEKARLRSMAKVGDAVCVTGYLGDSAGGLEVILNQLKPSPLHIHLINKHHHPSPLLSEGIFLAEWPGIHAMMDISDGIASDLHHILNASKVAAHIYLNKLPISEQLITVCNEQGWNAIDLATGGGEDYELLFTVDADKIETLQKEYRSKFGKSFIQIGEIIGGNPCIRWFKGGKEVKIDKTGFNHFK